MFDSDLQLVGLIVVVYHLCIQILDEKLQLLLIGSVGLPQGGLHVIENQVGRLVEFLSSLRLRFVRIQVRRIHFYFLGRNLEDLRDFLLPHVNRLEVLDPSKFVVDLEVFNLTQLELSHSAHLLE